MSNSDELLRQLDKDENFVKLQNISKAKSLNFYSITGMGSQEIKHSNTIAWFLDPNESHNLEAFFFKNFIKKLLEERSGYLKDHINNISNLLLDDLNDAKVIRESENNIDILFFSEKSNIILCIENKVKAKLSDTQLDKYYKYIEKEYPSKKYTKIYVLLSPDGHEVPEKKSKNAASWIPLSYKSIVEILRLIQKSNVVQKVQDIIKEYIEHLEKENIVENIELNELFEKLWKDHEKAIDLLVNYRNKVNKDIIKHNKEKITKIFQKSEIKEKIEIIEPGRWKNRFEFYTENMEKYFPPDVKIPGYFGDGRKYRYWIYLIEKPQEKLRVNLELGFLKQDNLTIKKLNKLLHELKPSQKTDMTAKNNYFLYYWKLGIDSLHDNKAEEKIISKIKEIIVWENEIGEIINGK